MLIDRGRASRKTPLLRPGWLFGRFPRDGTVAHSIQSGALSGIWSGQLDSNQRPAVPKTAALPGCAIPRLSGCRYTLERRYTLQAAASKAISGPTQRRLNRGWATRSPGAMPYFCAVPAITSSTPLASPPEEMIFVDNGSVFSAIAGCGRRRG